MMNSFQLQDCQVLEIEMRNKHAYDYKINESTRLILAKHTLFVQTESLTYVTKLRKAPTVKLEIYPNGLMCFPASFRVA